MYYLSSVIYGLVQGITEFLPVSSSGHLVLLHKIIPSPDINELAFDVILHLATLIAVLIYFFPDIIKIIKDFFASFKNFQLQKNKLGWYLILATIPGALAGYLLEEKAESIFRNPILVAIMLFVVGLLFLVAEKYSRQNNDITSLNAKNSLYIGLAQAIAIIPGTSRSGITILAGLANKLKREAAVKFSFLLSIPIIFGASLSSVFKIKIADFSASELSFLLLAFISALVSAFFAIKFMMKYTKNKPLNIFAYYRFALAVIIIIYFLLIK